MVLSDISVKRPVLAIVMSLIIVVVGAAALIDLPVREYPNIDPPVVSITTEYVGAGPEIIDTQITEVVEGAVAAVEGIRSITSESREGRGQTTVEFNLSRDVDIAANDIRDAISRILDDLPEDADPPVVRKADADARPVIWIALSSELYSPAELTDYARRNLIDRLSVIDGVANVRISGERVYAMRIWLDRQAMAARNLTVADVEAALRAGNVELPSGRVESDARELTVKADSRLSTPEQFAQLVIRKQGDYQILLGEIARVERGVADDRTIFRADGQPSIGLGMIRQSQANTIEVSDRVREAVKTISATLPEGVTMKVSYDESLFIRAAVERVLETLGEAVALVIVVIFLFLRTLRATLIPAFTIPVSIIGAFMLMPTLGFSINVLTLLALILAVGLVVDDAIVMLENIQRRIDQGEPPLLAAYRGARQVAFAIIATTITLVAVFIPISFMQGNVGRLFSEFGFVMAVAVAISGFVALTLAPMLCSKWLRRVSGEGWFHRGGETALNAATRGYSWLLRVSLGAPVVVLAIGLFFSALSYQLYQMLPQELAPTEDRGVIIMPSTAPEGTTPGATFQSLLEIEDAVQPFVDQGIVQRRLSVVGWGGVVNRGFSILGLVPWGERDIKQQAVTQQLFPKLAQIPGVRAFAVNPPGLGQSSFSQPVQVVIGGPNYETVKTWTDRLVARAEENPGLVNVDTNYEQTRPQLDVQIDRRRAADLGIRAEDIARTLQTMLASRTVGSYVDRGREYDVIVQARPEDRISPGDLANIFLRSASGDLIPLSSLVSFSEQGAPPRLTRVDRLPSITVSASLAPDYDLGSALRFFQKIAAEELPPEARLSYQGQSREFTENSSAIFVTFGLALLIVYLVLAAQFESFVHPMIIMLSVPLAVTGALLALLLAGISLNTYSQIGMVLLIGLMTKNGILIVEFANQLRDEGCTVREAVLEASILRFRPILMTSIATVTGALPLILYGGAGAESRGAIGAVVVGGVSFATVLTLFIIPVLYDLLARFTRSANAVELDLERLEAEERKPAPRPHPQPGE